MKGALCNKCQQILIIQHPCVCANCDATRYQIIAKGLCRAPPELLDFTKPRISDDETSYVFERAVVRAYCNERAFTAEMRAAWGYADPRYDALFEWMLGDYEGVALVTTPAEFIQQMPLLYYLANGVIGGAK